MTHRHLADDWFGRGIPENVRLGADVYIDNDRNGAPDDITVDGRVDTSDAERFARAVEKVEAKQPALVGGIGIYKAGCGHGPFTHVDTRGYRARWRGTGSG